MFCHNFNQFMHIFPHVPLVAEWLITFLTVPGLWYYYPTPKTPRSIPACPSGGFLALCSHTIIGCLRSPVRTNLISGMTIRNDRFHCFSPAVYFTNTIIFEICIYHIIYARKLLANEPDSRKSSL